MDNKLPQNLNWIKKAFNRTIQFTNDNNDVIGDIRFEPFSRIVSAKLNNVALKFDIHGFINKEVTITNDLNEELGHIDLNLRSKAKIQLKNGEIYLWKREDFFQHEWTMIHDLPNTDNDPVSVSYNRTRDFLTEKGSIQVEEKSTTQEELLVLTGFFLGFYFLRRRRKMAAVAMIGVAG
jgi:hypothetical protein